MFLDASKLKKHRTYLVWFVIILSLLPLFLTPLSGLQDQLTHNLPWVGIGILISELVFILGLSIIAWDVGEKLGTNPLKWRSKLVPAIEKSSHEWLFWVGFVVNTIGAIATAVIVAAGVFMSLPPQSWGLIILPLIDLSVTYAIRAAIVEWVKVKPHKRRANKA